MKDKICLVTGATSGIGQVTAEALAKQGATVVLVGRNRAKTERVQKEIKSRCGHDRVDFLIADLSIQADIRSLAEQFLSNYERLDILINNAGAIFSDYQVTEDGIERTFALNHLNYFLLTNLLLERLMSSAPARIVNVSSGAHEGGKIDFEDLGLEKKYSSFAAYSQSKLANILFTTELARRLEGKEVTVNALHPGFVATGFGSNMKGIAKYLMPIIKLFALTPEKGADTVIYLASSPEVDGISGKYFIKRKEANVSAIGADQAVAEKLWKVSEQLV